MKATGVVVEYNPFHNGHRHHLEQARKQTGADVLVAVMSGHFLQRGEPAIVDKWTRTKMALANGADLVIELPYAFSTAQAPQFASGAVQLLEAIGCSSFCFGSEEGRIEPFTNYLELLSANQELFDQTVKDAMQQGLSYPKALGQGYEKIVGAAPAETYADLTEPNNILGFHYMQAARTIGSSMRPATIPRTGAQFHDQVLSNTSIASATSIRQAIFSTGSLEEVKTYIPSSAVRYLDDWLGEGKSFQNWDRYYPLLRYSLLREEPEHLRQIADVTEGIEHLLIRAAKSEEHFLPFMQAVKSKRYTWTRIQRMLVHILTNFTYTIRSQIKDPSYLRLLGMTQAGRDYLRLHKKQLALPLISRVAAANDLSLAMDIKSTDLYYLALSTQHSTSQIGLDYRMPPIIL